MSTPILVTVKEASELLSLSSTEVYDLAAKGLLEKRYVGKGTRNFRLTYASLEQYAGSLSQDPIAS